MPSGKDLRSFKPRRDQINPELKKQAEKMGANNEQVEQAQRLSEQMNQYQGKSEQELMQELLRKTKDQKQKGQLDEAAIKKMRDAISPMLNEEQRKKLLSLIEMIMNQ
ncbi:MAG: hypothetical protein ACOYU3_03440 [Bacillota bacterium]